MRRSHNVSVWLLNCRSAIDFDSATEQETSEFLALLRQDIKDYYRPVEKPRVAIIEFVEHHHDKLISQMIAAARMMRYSGPPIKMAEIDYSSTEKRLLGHELSGVWLDEAYHIKSMRGAGKNPFAEPHISKHRK